MKKKLSVFLREKSSLTRTPPHPRLTRPKGEAQSAPADSASEEAYIVVAVGGRTSRIRWVHEPDLQTPRLPDGVTEITVRRPEGVVTLHGKEPPSRYLAAAAKQYGGDE